MLRVLEIKQNRPKLLTDEQLLVLSEKVVSRYVYAGTIPLKDKEDVVMSMVEKFLIKHDSIKKAYNGDAKITTYCIAVLNRMCCEVIRKEFKSWRHVSDFEMIHPATSELSSSEKLIIDDEVKLLGKIILFFDQEFYKVRLFLACYYQLPLHDDDIQGYDPNNKAGGLIKSIQRENDLSKGNTFEILATIVNQVEGKQIKPDAVRMWLNKVIETLIARLNGPFNRSQYTKETLQLLFEYLYLEKNNPVAKSKESIKYLTLVLLWVISSI